MSDKVSLWVISVAYNSFLRCQASLQVFHRCISIAANISGGSMIKMRWRRGKFTCICELTSMLSRVVCLQNCCLCPRNAMLKSADREREKKARERDVGEQIADASSTPAAQHLQQLHPHLACAAGTHTHSLTLTPPLRLSTTHQRLH